MLVVQLDMSNKNWIKPPNTIARKDQRGKAQKLSYWIDEKGKYQLYSKNQLATLNILTNLNLLLIRALILLDTLKDMDENTKIKTLIRQDYAKYEADKSSVFNHLVELMAAVPNITFGEFLNFISSSTKPQVLNKMGQKTLKEVLDGKSKAVDVFYNSDRFKNK